MISTIFLSSRRLATVKPEIATLPLPVENTCRPWWRGLALCESRRRLRGHPEVRVA